MNVYLPILVIGAGIAAALVIGFDLYITTRREAQAREARP